MKNIIFIALSIIDILAGVMIFSSNILFFHAYVGYVMIFCLAKGVWSVFSSIAAGYHYDWMGIIDIVAGITLFLISSGISSEISQFIGMVMVFKGLYSLTRSVLSV